MRGVWHHVSLVFRVSDAPPGESDWPGPASEDDRFMMVTRHDADEFDYSPSYLNIARSDDLVVIQITVSNTRSVGKKQALYRRIVECLADNPGLRREDVFISLVEVLPQDWSFGNGRAQYVEAAG